MVGFSCFSEGRQTKPVKVISQKVKKRKYKSISKFLKSDNASEQYLAVIVLEKLDSKKLYKLSEKERELINEVKSSEKGVYVCSGCILDGKLELKKLFMKEFENFNEHWLNNILFKKEGK